MHLATGWTGVAATLRQASFKSIFFGAVIAAAAAAPFLGLPARAFIVAGMGAITVALAEGALGVQPATGVRERVENVLFFGVLGPILAWLSGLAGAAFMWETGLVDADFSIWMLAPGNVFTWVAVLAFAYFRGASVPQLDNSATKSAAVESAA